VKGKSVAALVLVLMLPVLIRAQTQVDLSNGFKPWGSYDGSSLDTIGLENGNLMLHAPVLPKFPQRGSLSPDISLYLSSHNWVAICASEDPMSGTPSGCQWGHGGTGIWFELVGSISIQRTVESTTDPLGGFDYFVGGGYALTTWDGASHQLFDTSGGNLSSFITMDGTAYQVTVSNPDQYGVPQDVTVTNRSGEQRTGTFGGARCSDPHWFAPRPAGNYARVYDQWQSSPTVCVEHSLLQKIVDRNGNVMSFQAPLISATPSLDTTGRPSWPLQGGNLGDSSNCISTLPFAQSVLYTYPGANGAQNQIKVCMGTPTLQTFFGLGGVTEYQNTTVASQTPTPIVTSIILPDGTHWVFNYDSYGNIISIQLPTGGSISYSWTTLYPGITTPCAMTHSGLPVPAARAISQRTLIDNNGHSSIWNYHWGGVAADGSITNWVTGPDGNDTVHVFKAVASSQCFGSGTSPGFREIRTQYFKGTKDAGTLLKQVDTSYGRATMLTGNSGLSFEANIFPTDIQTTVYPASKVNLVHRDYDYAFGANGPSAGAVTAEKIYDWGSSGPGALLRETDTTYKWQANGAYLTAGMIDLPATVVVKDGSGNRVAETDYAYDEPGYLQTYMGALPAGTHGNPPNSVRGNQTTVSHWLNTSNSSVASHAFWYDTGEMYQSSDPLGQTSTYSYDPQFGVYRTQTCSPATAAGSVTHCVNGTYDSTLGLLASFTDQNNQTTNYSYDSLTSRFTSALAPADPANSNVRAQTQFNYSAPNVFPMTVQVLRPVTAALTDSLTSTYDGLGRVFKTENAMPAGPPATVTTDFDAVHNTVTATNPYFSTGDPTYGSAVTLSDVLGRPIQVTEQDGSLKTISYDVVAPSSAGGDCTMVTDEAGNPRRTCSDALGRLTEVDEPHSGTPASYAQATVIISGSEQSNPLPAASGSAYVDIGGGDGTNQVCTDPLPPKQPICTTTTDAGSISIQVGSYPAKSASFPNPSTTAAGLASSLASAFHNDTSAPADAVVDPAIPTRVDLTARDTGLASNYAFSVSPLQSQAPDFYATPSGSAFTGGRNGSASPDTGTVTVSITANNVITPYQVSYGGSDTPLTIAQHLAGLINAGTLATATASSGTPSNPSGPGATLTITADVAGPGSNYPLTTAFTYDTVHFAQASFIPSPASGAFSGGYNAGDFDNNPFVTLYSYDALGNLVCVEQHGGVTGTGCSAAPTSDATSPWRVRRFTYDSLSRLLSSSNPESNTALDQSTPPNPFRVPTTYSYDADGNLLMKTSPASNQTGSLMQTVSYCYDELHRVTGKAYSAQTCQGTQLPAGTAAVTYTYDSGLNAKGHLTGVTDQAGSASYSYDVLGRLSSETRVIAGVSKSVSYDYNLDGSLKTLHYPSGAAVTYTPDSAGRILSAVDSGNSINYVTGATYQADGRMTGFLSGNGAAFAGITNSFSYNKRLQPVNMSASSPSQTVFSIGYDFHLGNGTTGSNNGNVWNIYNYRDRTRDQSFTYDALNRLISAQNAGTNCAASTVNGKTEYWGNSYGYDAWGNLVGKSVTKCSAENLTLTALVNNQLSGYGYDAAGNMTSDPTDGVTASYDAENRIASATRGGVTTSYVYDADGNRVEKSGGGSGTLYWYMTPGIVAESDPAGNLQSEYVFLNGERVARRDGVNGAGGVFYYFSDHLKTASVITNSVGTPMADSDYYPWGGDLQFVNNDTNHYKFTGKERDSETGLDYFGARYYSNGLGRFISADWSATPIPVPYADFADPQSLNLYSYVRNLPTIRIDPDGHCCWEEAKSFAVGVAKELHNMAANYAANGFMGEPVPAAVGEATGLTGMGTGEGASPVIESPSNGAEAAGMATVVVAPLIIAAATSTPAEGEGTAAEGELASAPKAGRSAEPPQLRTGKEAHAAEPIRPGEKAEVRTPSGKRMDRYNAGKAHIREIKPDNPRGHTRGQKQLAGYKKEMDQATGKDHTTELTTYKPKDHR
jgi:RHS repeat-associated protein